LPVQVDGATHARLLAAAASDPSLELIVDLEAQELTLEDGTKAPFPLDPFSRTCLLQGKDELGYILSFEPKISAYESAHGT
jgi:3-isopropylmalate/(R)-2-methylmalate dehydratase small subunit